ncbi:MAG: hypothetical protein LBU77_00300 [Clostridiales bacterium]|nr:hypothetical protein [Clostridiales bacterium]
MKRKIVFVTSLALMLSTLCSSSLCAFNSDNPENAGKYFAFNQFYVDHFTGCANGDVDYLSHYNDKTTPLASASARDRMQYIADNEWIPIAGYSPSENVMRMYFCGEQNLDYTGQAIQINPDNANDSLADAIKGLSASDIKSLRDMSKEAASFDFYLDYKPEKVSNNAFAVSPIYKDFDNFIRLFESKQINVTVGKRATLKLDASIKINALTLSESSILDLSTLAENELPEFNSLNQISSDGGTIIFAAGTKDNQKQNFLAKVSGTYKAITLKS